MQDIFAEFCGSGFFHFQEVSKIHSRMVVLYIYVNIASFFFFFFLFFCAIRMNVSASLSPLEAKKGTQSVIHHLQTCQSLRL